MKELDIPQLMEVSSKSSSSSSKSECSNDTIARLNSSQEASLGTEYTAGADLEKSIKPDHCSLFNCVGFKFDQYFDCVTCGKSSTVLDTMDNNVSKSFTSQITTRDMFRKAFNIGIVAYIKSRPSPFASSVSPEQSIEEYYSLRWNGKLPLAPILAGYDTEYRRRNRSSRKRSRSQLSSASTYPVDLERDCRIKSSARNFDPNLSLTVNLVCKIS